MNQPEDSQPLATSAVSRRRAIKAGAAVAVGTAVWAEPTIKGLARRPAYAATTSGGLVSFTVTMDLGRNTCDTVSQSGVELEICRDNGNGYTFTLTPAQAGAQLGGSVTIEGGDVIDLTGQSSGYTGNGGNNGNQPRSVDGTVTCEVP